MFLFPPGQDTSPSKGYPLAPKPPPLPPQYILRYPFIHLGVVKYYDSEVSWTRTQHSHLSEACTRTFSIRSQNTNHWVTTPPIYYLNKCTLENLRICISKPWLLKCQSIMTEKMFRIVSVLNESIEMMLKCLRNRGVISFLPPPGGPMADTSNWSTSFRIDVSFLEAKRAIRYKAITFGCDGATRRGTGSSRRGANALRVHGKGSLFWRCAWDPWDYGLSDAFTSSYDLRGLLFTSVIELKNLDFLAMWPSFAKRLLRNHTHTGKVTTKKTESLLSLVGIYFQRRLWPCTLF